MALTRRETEPTEKEQLVIVTANLADVEIGDLCEEYIYQLTGMRLLFKVNEVHDFLIHLLGRRFNGRILDIHYRHFLSATRTDLSFILAEVKGIFKYI